MAPRVLLQQLWSGHRLPLVVVGVLLLGSLVLAGAVQFYLVPTVNLREQQLLRRQAEMRSGGARSLTPVQQFTRGEKDLAVFLGMIPPHREFTGLIAELQELADAAGLQLTQVSYRHETDEKRQLLSYQLGFALDGQYRDIKQFIHDLEQSQRLVIIEQINLQGDSQGEVAGVRLQLNLRTYFRVEAS
jgi:Tfp pilus assembly protein PilO